MRKARALEALGVSMMVSGVAVLSAACASMGGRGGDEAARHRAGPVYYRVAQLFYGGASAFGLCAEPACPATTKKTRAGAQRHVAMVAEPRSAEPPVPVSEVEKADPVARVQPPAARGEGVDAAPVAMETRAVEAAGRNRESEPATLGARVEELSVRFAFGAAELTPEARRVLLASVGSARSAERIRISGRTDSVGPEQVNDAIALARAMRVREFIRRQVPEMERAIVIDAKGACCYVGDNATAAGRAQNRRVDVVLNLARS